MLYNALINTRYLIYVFAIFMFIIVFSPYLFSKECYIQYPLSKSTSCPDGNYTTIMTVFNNTYPWYIGNITYITISNTISNPYNIYNNPCTIQSGKSSVCFMQILPFPITSGNGGKNFNITIYMENSNVYINKTYINVTVCHYLNENETALIKNYSILTNEFNKIKNQYSYYCSTYLICNNTLNSSIINTSIDLEKLNNSINKGNYSYMQNFKNQIYYLSYLFNKYNESINFILPNIISGNSYIARSVVLINSNSSLLNNCSYKNGTTYASYLKNKINSLRLYKINNESSSIAFLSNAKSLYNQTNYLIADCKQPAQTSFNITLNANVSILVVLGLALIVVLIFVYILGESLRENKKEETSKIINSNVKEENENKSSLEDWLSKFKI